MTQEEWLSRAALCELLAMTFRLPTRELVAALTSGEYADALTEAGTLNGLSAPLLDTATKGLAGYPQAPDAEALFHNLRAEFTRMFVGSPEPVASPYAGIWWAVAQGVKPMLFVNTRSMGVERAMRQYGIGQAEGKNEPLDHIATMLEFLQYVSLVQAGSVQPQEGVTVPPEAYETFVQSFISDWIGDFTARVTAESREPLYQQMAPILAATLQL